MTQAEFARSVGWSRSTISRWETGRARPSAAALAAILAFGATATSASSSNDERDPDATCPDELPPVHPDRERSPGVPQADSIELGHSRPASAVPARRAPILSLGPVLELEPSAWEREPRILTVATKHPRWSAEVRLHIGARPVRPGAIPLSVAAKPKPHRRSWLGGAGVLVASLAVFLMIGWPGEPLPKPPVKPRVAIAAVESPLERAAEVASPPADPVVVPARTFAPSSPEEASVEKAPDAPVRLAGVVLAGGVRNATFRVATGSVTIAEGDWLGERQVTRIGRERVEIRQRMGRIDTVLVGGRVPTS
jgi:transcriptional regulator with XRE-family HTH domain